MTVGDKRSHSPDGENDAPTLPVPFALRNRIPSILNARTQSMHMRRSLLADAIDTQGFPYLHEVKGHSSCVNALAFSRGSGQWMASGGDDLRILIRDLFDFDAERPGGAETSAYRIRARLLGHFSNIFSLTWSVGNKYLFSGANDCLFFAYDLQYGDTPIRQVQPQVERHRPSISFGLHEASIREVSAHPTNPDLALSSSDDGDIYLLDMRLPGQVAQYGYFRAQIESAQWNPNPSDGHRFVVGSAFESGSCAALFDVRNVFHGSDLAINSNDTIVRYATRVHCKKSNRMVAASPESTGAQFDPSGRFLAVDLSLYHPVLFATESAEPLAEMSSVALHPHTNPIFARKTPLPADEMMGYRNSCTIKRGSFGFEAQTGHLYYVAGSDDFRAYGWKIPPMESLLAQRQALSKDAWKNNEAVGYDNGWFQSLTDDLLYQPVHLSTPTFTLEGSRSIVNSALCHPTLPMIATAGIERLVRYHYATPMSMAHLQPNWSVVRPQTRHRLRTVNVAAVLRAMGRPHRTAFMDPDPEQRSSESSPVQTRAPSSRASRDPRQHTEAELADEETIALFDELLREEESRSILPAHLDGIGIESDEALSNDSDDPDSDVEPSSE
ncbi:hypothetical protein MNAN1_000938 [Malassezia nana]|uniref:Uncharacterized protein n=1 Tax=Malassezia nana TaxID=180528 RepID=A0AAF0EHP6_9BASI|nr:hypothetical protein MNAN1_000938 [Malassezia nana]